MKGAIRERPISPTAIADPLDFTLPLDREAAMPPEVRPGNGGTRDAVRLMVSYAWSDRVVHADRFANIERFLDTGDLLVLNTSGTRPAAVPVARRTGDATALVVHFSVRQKRGNWVVELRESKNGVSRPFGAGREGERLSLPEGGELRLLHPHGDRRATGNTEVRLWNAEVQIPADEEAYFLRNGSPIRYGYVPQAWPLSFYQTVYATEVGSAEMPSAGRAFTEKSITRLVARGVRFAPLVLHTGVASLEEHEPPYAEYYRVPADTARAVNETRKAGKRVIAIGTTVVRALETVTDTSGMARAGEGWTDIIITPERGVHAVDGLLTGFHEPRASHLAMLEAIAGRPHLIHAYEEALRGPYLWHEFGDLHLLLQR